MDALVADATRRVQKARRCSLSRSSALREAISPQYAYLRANCDRLYELYYPTARPQLTDGRTLNDEHTRPNSATADVHVDVTERPLQSVIPLSQHTI